MGDLASVEARLFAILDPYREQLEEGAIYGVPMLRRREARAHDWFAGVQMANGAVKFNLLPMHSHPALLEGISPALRKLRTGVSVFKFTEIDERLFAELVALVARSFELYMDGDAAAGGG